jgi:hypothetical protein
VADCANNSAKLRDETATAPNDHRNLQVALKQGIERVGEV